MAKSWRNGWCEEQPHPIDVRSGVNENSSAVPFLDQRITLFNLWRWYQNVFQSSCLLLTLMGSTSSPILAICSHPGGCKWWFTAVSVGISLMIGDTPLGSVGKETAFNAGDLGSIPRTGRAPGAGNGNPLQYPCLGNPMDRGAWRATVHGVTTIRHNSVHLTT